MGFSEAFFGALKKAVERAGSQSIIQEKSKIPQSSFNGIFKGKATDPRLKAIDGIINAFDNITFAEFIRAIRPELQIDILQAKDLHEIKTYNIVNIEKLEDLTDEHLEFILKIPNHYFPSDFAIIMRGQSMDAIIPEGSAVGITKKFDFSPSELYLCVLPYEKLTIKRVILYPDNNILEFRAESKEQDEKLRPHTYPFQEGITKIVGQVTWIASRRKK